MDNKEIETKQQPAPVQEASPENAILEMLKKMDSRLSDLETNIRQPAKPAPIPQNSLKFYDNKPNKPTEVIEPEYMGGLEPKTYGELRTEASKDLQKERQEFLYNQQFGTALQKSKMYGRNEMHLEECAVLGIYENSDSRFKEIIRDKIEMLKNCDYVGLAETSMAEDERSKIIHRTLFNHDIPLYDEKMEMLKNQVMEIAAKRL